jgi:hypothetical protein
LDPNKERVENASANHDWTLNHHHTERIRTVSEDQYWKDRDANIAFDTWMRTKLDAGIFHCRPEIMMGDPAMIETLMGVPMDRARQIWIMGWMERDHRDSQESAPSPERGA